MTTVENKTRKLRLVQVDNTSLFRLEWEGGGRLPKVLEGMFTKREAEKAAKKYSKKD